LDEIGSVGYEEMSFKVKVYGRPDGRTPDEKPFVTGALKM
jgi:hypothetical protein